MKGEFKEWPGWGMADPTGTFFKRGEVSIPEPISTFHQVAWDDHNQRVVYYAGSMTFSYQPETREWTVIHEKKETPQPPENLLWSSLCYDPVNKRIILFGGGGLDRVDGRLHTWSLDVTNDTWEQLDLDQEPPARTNSPMVYDKKRKQIVLFGGDGQDRYLADTWVFDVTEDRWQRKHPEYSPPPYSGPGSKANGHAMIYLNTSGFILLVGKHEWVYKPGENNWYPLDVNEISKGGGRRWITLEGLPGTDEAILSVSPNNRRHRRVTYRFSYDPGMDVDPSSEEAKPYKPLSKEEDRYRLKTKRTKEWYEDQPEPDPEAVETKINQLPKNKWVKFEPPKSTTGRTWGTAIFDTKRGNLMKWGGGHSGYQGTDMAFYDTSQNRWTIDRTPAFKPAPFGARHSRPRGRTFFNQPWTYHQRHTCAYDRRLDVGVFTHAGGSSWYVRSEDSGKKWTWIYDPEERKWMERLIPQPFPGGLSVSPIAFPTPEGVMVYHKKRLYQFKGKPDQPESWHWEQIDIQNDRRPYQREFMTIVYDSKRNRLIFLSKGRKSKKTELWFFLLRRRNGSKIPIRRRGAFPPGRRYICRGRTRFWPTDRERRTKRNGPTSTCVKRIGG